MVRLSRPPNAIRTYYLTICLRHLADFPVSDFHAQKTPGYPVRTINPLVYER